MHHRWTNGQEDPVVLCHDRVTETAFPVLYSSANTPKKSSVHTDIAITATLNNQFNTISEANRDYICQLYKIDCGFYWKYCG